jgi:transposase-like protein
MKYKNREWLFQEYTINKHSIGDIAAKFGVTTSTIDYWLKKFGITKRTLSEASWTPSFMLKKRPGINLKYRDRDWLYQKYVIEQKSLKEIALETGIPSRTVYVWLLQFGINPRTTKEALSTERFHRRNRGKHSGEKSPRWNGGKKVACGGYVLVAAKDHPLCDSCGYVMEHRLVMEKILGRYLKPEEAVHHVDGDVKNNKPDNLILFSSTGEHTAHHAALRAKVRISVSPAILEPGI